MTAAAKSSFDDGFLQPEEIAEIRRTFFDQARTALEVMSRQVLALEGQVPTAARLKPLKRAAHTFKGDCASVGFPQLSSLAHALEDALAALEGRRRVVSPAQADLLLAAGDALQTGLDTAAATGAEPPVASLVKRLRGITSRAQGARSGRSRQDPVAGDVEVMPASAAEAPAEPSRDGETVRIEARRVDEVLNLIGEMVTARAMIAGVTAEIEPTLSEDLAARLADAQSLLGRVLQDLQRSAMRMRMVPAARVFRRFSRMARDLGRATGKSLALHIEGEATELDRGILDALEEPLLHLVRNAVDHGLEAPADRAAAGKPAEGRITLRASREGNQVLVEVTDDGRGIDADAVRERARAGEGAPPPSDEDALQLVFQPGLSTAARVTETSGRGVGLDVVRETVEALRGSIRAANLPDGGASFLMKVPLTVAIIQALLFRVSGREAAVPLTSVVEIAQARDVVRSMGGREICCLRDATLGLARLDRLMGLGGSDGADGYVLVLQSSAGRFGLLVDELIGEQELVIKAVHDRWVRTPLVAGASVLGRGSLALILDVLAVHRASFAQGSHARA